MIRTNSSRIDAAVALAAELQQRATALQSTAERRQQAELDRLLRNPRDKATLVQLTDQAFRSQTAARTAEQFTHILDVQGIPRFFSPLEQAMLRGFQTFGGWLPSVTVPLVRAHLQHETANVVLPAEPELLGEHLAARQRQRVRMNLNFLGESLLGEDEARERLNKYLAALQTPEVEVMSVKISTIYSQISPLAREYTLRQLGDRLERLYRAAEHLRYRRPDGLEVPKFIYLDMEEYRDLHLTAEAFMRTLSRPGLEDIAAGIALQAYIPDSFLMQQRLTKWAMQRVTRGGSPITIRIVKGANMEMERIDAALHDWPQTPFTTKVETDANYKQMLHYGMAAEHLACVRLGVASHNLFDVSYAIVLADELAAGDRVQFEMLEGMATHQRRALLERDTSLLLYAPACRKEEFLHAIGYLIRRLDENTGPENFLRHAFRLQPGSEDWLRLEQSFRQAFTIDIDPAPRRSQNRLREEFPTAVAEMPIAVFRNEADTDWSLPQNSTWASLIAQRGTDRWRSQQIPLVVAGRERMSTQRRPCLNPSRPDLPICDYSLATERDVEEAVAIADNDPSGWRLLPLDERNRILGEVARELRRARGDLIHAAMINGGKLISESDPEVSEAIDFVEYYRAAARRFHQLPTISVRGCGVVVVVPPWNFPLAIPCGGMAAALAAGNTVILKPASDTVLVAWELCQCFWRAGVPRTALQFLPCPGRDLGSRLVSHPKVTAVILTGGTSTALAMLDQQPAMRLSAETGGKNAMIVTALADRELAIKQIVHSAFGHSGQKCSATSLLLLDAEVYDDASFKRMLCDSVRSLPVAEANDLAARMGPLIRPPSELLEQALKTLEPGESWAVMPEQIGDNPQLWSPGVKYGVTAGSVTHLTEFFGPVLGVMRYSTLSEAIELVNATGYGLTSGIHSLDEREVSQWLAEIRAGNLYVNRGTTGAIVGRQPFGGMGLSAFGPGIKAGGPNYVACFLEIMDRVAEVPGEGPVAEVGDIERPDLRSLVLQLDPSTPLGDAMHRVCVNYERAWREEFSREMDDFRLLGQDNLRRYLAFAEVVVRVTPQDSWYEILARIVAARVTGARVIVSLDQKCPTVWPDQLELWTESWGGQLECVFEHDEALGDHLAQPGMVRVRYADRSRVPTGVRRVATQQGTWIADVPVVGEGRVELLWYLREQTISNDYHRYGNLGLRADEHRRPLVH